MRLRGWGWLNVLNDSCLGQAPQCSRPLFLCPQPSTLRPYLLGLCCRTAIQLPPLVHFQAYAKATQAVRPSWREEKRHNGGIHQAWQGTNRSALGFRGRQQWRQQQQEGSSIELGQIYQNRGGCNRQAAVVGGQQGDAEEGGQPSRGAAIA